MQLTVDESFIFFKESIKGKDELFSFIADTACSKGIIQDEDRKNLLTALHDREKVGSTLITDKIAMPHARCPFVSKLCIFIISTDEPLDYDSEGKAQYFFPLLAPTAANDEFIDALSKIAQIIMDDDIREYIYASNKEELVKKVMSIFH